MRWSACTAIAEATNGNYAVAQDVLRHKKMDTTLRVYKSKSHHRVRLRECTVSEVAHERWIVMRGDVVPAVDPDDFKKVWDVRNSVFGNLIDVDTYRSLCKPDTDVKATVVRANFLFTLTRNLTEKFAKIMDRGQLNEAFLSTFANIPLVEGEEVNVENLLRLLETAEQTDRV